MKLKILAAVFVIGTLLTFSTGCDICDILNCPGPGLEPKPEPGQVLVFDDFEDSADSAWSAASGTWIVERGRYTVQEEDSFGKNTYVKTDNSLFWENYAIDVDILNAPSGRGGIIVRAQDDLNKVMLRWLGDYNMCWLVLVNASWAECREAVSPGLTVKAHVRIEVVGNTYTAYVRQGDQGQLIKRTWFTDDTFTHGMPGLNISIKGEQAFDNFKVTSLGP